MFKRRQLNKGENQGPKKEGNPPQPRQAPRPQNQGPKPQNQSPRPQAKTNFPGPHGHSNTQPQRLPNQNKNQPRPSGQRQQNNNRRPQHRPAPPKPPAFFQRDILLVVSEASAKGLNEVRAKYDPLAKKVPAHVTLVFSEPREKILPTTLEGLSAELPSLKSINFTHVIIQDEKYLWLTPDEEGASKLKAWYNHFSQKLGLPAPESAPHITLGYLPHTAQPDQVMELVKTHVSLPLAIEFSDILLEEFDEDQVSRTVQKLPVP